MPEIESLYWGWLSRPGPEVDLSTYLAPRLVENAPIMRPFTVEEVKMACKHMDPTSAAGPDGLTAREVRSVNSAILTNVFNCSFLDERMPRILKRGRLILL